MAQGVRAKIKVNNPSICQMTDISASYDTECRSITWNNKNGSEVVEEFISTKDINGKEIEKIFNYSTESVYRFKRKKEECMCEFLNKHDVPISEAYTENLDLYIVFYAENVKNLKQIISELSKKEKIEIQYLVHSLEKDRKKGNSTFIDLDRLTDRQKEVLNKAYDMGYFEHPKKANAGNVAEELDISLSTFVEHLSTAQKKILKQIKN